MLIGRRKKGIEPRRNFTVRLSEAERELLASQADYCDMKESDYLRELIHHGGAVDTRLAEDRRDFINQISRIGNNYNQIVRNANASGYVTESTMGRANELFEELLRLVQEVLRKWR